VVHFFKKSKLKVCEIFRSFTTIRLRHAFYDLSLPLLPPPHTKKSRYRQNSNTKQACPSPPVSRISPRICIPSSLQPPPTTTVPPASAASKEGSTFLSPRPIYWRRTSQAVIINTLRSLASEHSMTWREIVSAINKSRGFFMAAAIIVFD